MRILWFNIGCFCSNCVRIMADDTLSLGRNFKLIVGTMEMMALDASCNETVRPEIAGTLARQRENTAEGKDQS